MNTKVILAAAAMVALAACTGTQLNNAQSMKANSTDFGNALSANYLRLAQAEYAEADYADSDYFALQSIAAGTAGTVVEPPEPNTRDLPADGAGAAQAGYAALVAVLNRGAREKAPQLAATAQSSYECWIQELEENNQPAHIAACREQFEGLIPALQTAVGTPKKAKPVKGQLFKVFFDTGSARLNDAANEVIAEAAKHAENFSPARVVVSGYTDTSGGAAANQALSDRRAAVVAAALRIRGVARDAIKTNAYGEKFPDKRTGDGVSAQENRRVEISVAP